MSDQSPPPNPNEPPHGPPPSTGGPPPPDAGYGQPGPYPQQPPYGGQYPPPYGQYPAYGEPYPPPYGGQQQPYGAPVPYGPYGLPYGGRPALPLAHRGKRLLARVIDDLIFAALATALIVPLWLLANSQDPHGETAWVAVGIVGTVLIVIGGWILYEGLQLAKWGRTLGKRSLGLRVVSARPPGAPLSRGRAIGRAAIYPAGFLVMNFLPVVSLVGLLNPLWQFWDKPYHQCIHDKMADTIVIDDVAPHPGPF